MSVRHSPPGGGGPPPVVRRAGGMAFEVSLDTKPSSPLQQPGGGQRTGGLGSRNPNLTIRPPTSSPGGTTTKALPAVALRLAAGRQRVEARKAQQESAPELSSAREPRMATGSTAPRSDFDWPGPPAGMSDADRENRRLFSDPQSPPTGGHLMSALLDDRPVRGAAVQAEQRRVVDPSDRPIRPAAAQQPSSRWDPDERPVGGSGAQYSSQPPSRPPLSHRVPASSTTGSRFGPDAAPPSTTTRTGGSSYLDRQRAATKAEQDRQRRLEEEEERRYQQHQRAAAASTTTYSSQPPPARAWEQDRRGAAARSGSGGYYDPPSQPPSQYSSSAYDSSRGAGGYYDGGQQWRGEPAAYPPSSRYGPQQPHYGGGGGSRTCDPFGFDYPSGGSSYNSGPSTGGGRYHRAASPAVHDSHTDWSAAGHGGYYGPPQPRPRDAWGKPYPGDFRGVPPPPHAAGSRGGHYVDEWGVMHSPVPVASRPPGAGGSTAARRRVVGDDDAAAEQERTIHINLEMIRASEALGKPSHLRQVSLWVFILLPALYLLWSLLAARWGF